MDDLVNLLLRSELNCKFYENELKQLEEMDNVTGYLRWINTNKTYEVPLA